ncbi:MAG: VanW family protein [Candidatus Aegiribacteria sp.]|nr:VanW family protein [Candidatus Aegiribacteria sp.]
MSRSRSLSSVSPVIYSTSVFLRRQHRRLRWYLGREKYAMTKSEDHFPETVVSHSSILMRKLAGTDQALQRNKITSLKTAASLINSVVINPGEVFSFWRLVGKPVERRGFLPGLQLSFGKLVSMVGGGLCQFSNLLHWMILHTPMEITERHRHSFDSFPDYRRTVPFGTGATLFYNYLDFMFRNSTPWRFQLKTWVDESSLQGEIRSEVVPPGKFVVEERDHRFIRVNGTVYRENELWRIETDSASSEIVTEELLMKNHAEVLYDVSEIPGIEVIEFS